MHFQCAVRGFDRSLLLPPAPLVSPRLPHHCWSPSLPTSNNQHFA
nr:unnamed protein product [Digitaria exilis]